MPPLCNLCMLPLYLLFFDEERTAVSGIVSPKFLPSTHLILEQKFNIVKGKMFEFPNF